MIVKNRFGREYFISDEDRFFQHQLRNDIFQRQNIQSLYKLKPNCRTIIDIGANLGSNTIEYATWALEVHAFEPTSETYELLCKNIKANLHPNMKIIHGIANPNVYTGNVSTYKVALGNTNENKHIKKFVDNKGRNYVIDKLDSDTEEITIRTLDSYNFKFVDAIKIDAEGYELFILEGAIETILQNKPVIQVEIQDILCERYNVNVSDIFLWFKNNGYKEVHRNAHDFFYVPI
jgi:FkbM family methyltransferase